MASLINRIPVVKRLPVARLIALAEVAVIAHEHIGRLEPKERRRIVELLRRGRGRPSNLSGKERRELALLVAKAEPRLFARSVAKKFNPISR
jgi:antitoxin (DNA-binding transcriptional repressor) of toxin-antitoxin stability system